MIAGYTPGKTATIATTVYQLWRTNDEAGAMQWVLVDIVISAVVLLAVAAGAELALLGPARLVAAVEGVLQVQAG